MIDAKKTERGENGNATQESELPEGKKLGGCTGKGFMPGQSGNARGSSRVVRDIRQLTREIGEEYDPKMGKSKDRHLMETLYRRACQGNMKAAELYLAYGYGRPAQSVDMKISSPEEHNASIERLLAVLDTLPAEPDERTSDKRVN